MKKLSILFLTLIPACASLSPLQMARLSIDDTVKLHKADFKKCYEDQYPDGSHKAEGVVTIWFLVEMDGTVSKTSLKHSTLGNPMVETCLMTTMTNLQFESKLDDREIEIVYPFKFTTR